MLKINNNQILENWLPPIKNWTHEVNFNNKNFINVYCTTSGKSGSTALFNSFVNIGLSAMHVHTSNYFLYNIVRKKHPPFPNFSIFDYINYEQEKFDSSPIIIDVIREPIARRISAFFQNINIHYKEICDWHRLDLTYQEFLDFFENQPKFLIRFFNDKFLLRLENYFGFDEWCNDGLHLENLEFDKSKSYQKIEHNNKTFFVLKFSNIDNWQSIFNNNGFLDFKFLSANSSSEKAYGKLYKNFKKEYQIPKISFDIIYEFLMKDRLQLFLTDKEILKMKSAWKNKIIDFNPIPKNFDRNQYIKKRPKIKDKFKSELGVKYHYLAFVPLAKRKNAQIKTLS